MKLVTPFGHPKRASNSMYGSIIQMINLEIRISSLKMVREAKCGNAKVQGRVCQQNTVLQNKCEEKKAYWF